MEPGKPFGEESVPTGDHGETRAGAEVHAKRSRVVQEKQNDCDRNDKAREAEGMRAYAQSLRNGANDVHGVRGDECQNRTGGEDVDQCDEGRRDEDRASEVANRVTGFTGEDGDVLKTAERAKHHLGENAEAEHGHWWHYQA